MEVADAAAMGGDVAWRSSGSYDVFLSLIESDDVCLNSTGVLRRRRAFNRLYECLARVGIRAFGDSEERHFGDEIDEELLTAIDGAKTYIPIFSENYASCKRCLQELAAMVESKEKSGRRKTIFPIFYRVEPRDVRLVTPLYRNALELKGWIGSEEAKAWENALKEVGSLPGYTESFSILDLIHAVVEDVMHKVKVNEGIDKQVEDMMHLLDLEVSDVRIVGIWGKNGVGKTTLAEVIYKQISSQFDRCSFLADIGAMLKQPGGFQLLRRKLMSDIQDQVDEFDLAEGGGDFFEETLPMIKVLIVLDDLDVYSHFNDIFGEEGDLFGHGSRIIVTTSNKSVLSKLTPQLDSIYCMGMMNDNQALELFSKHAPQGNLPIPDFDEIARGIIDSVNGIPLLIKVIGSLLSRKVVEEWTALKKLNLQLGPYVERILMASYEEWSKEEKEIFLDIACLPADVDRRIASFPWHNPNLLPSDGVDARGVISLIKIGNHTGNHNALGMHRLLREFGQQIIRKEDDSDPRMLGRLCNLALAWGPKDGGGRRPQHRPRRF